MKQSWKPGTVLYPLPAVLVSCGAAPEEYNMLTVAWTGTVCSDPPMCFISVRPERHSHAIISRTGEFVINLTTRRLARAADWCGVRSGRDFDKFREMGLTAVPSEKVAAPLIAESPVNIECRVRQVLPLGTHDMFLAEVVGVQADEAYIDPATGRFCLERADPIVYSHGEYFALGEALGHFGWSVRKRKRRRRDADISDSLCFGVVTTLFRPESSAKPFAVPCCTRSIFSYLCSMKTSPIRYALFAASAILLLAGCVKMPKPGTQNPEEPDNPDSPPDGIPLSLRR